MESHITERFRAAYRSLPPTGRRQAREAYRRFRDNPHHPGLRFRQFHPSRPIFSARISRNYRALGIREADPIVWFWIATHTENDALLARL
jgi:hypothetical protein